jgi:hypothetical protein
MLYTHHITAAGFLGVPSNMVNESDYLLDNSRSLPVKYENDDMLSTGNNIT